MFFYLFIYFIVIANILFFKSIAWNLLSQIPYSVSVSVIPFPFPDSGFRIPCFSAADLTFRERIHDLVSVIRELLLGLTYGISINVFKNLSYLSVIVHS